jgi:SAM-dependent methyltransferase
VTGVETSGVRLARSTESAAASGAAVKLVSANMLHLLPDSSVDLVSILHGAHLQDTARALACSHRILKPGRFLVVAWNDWWAIGGLCLPTPSSSHLGSGFKVLGLGTLKALPLRGALGSMTRCLNQVTQQGLRGAPFTRLAFQSASAILGATLLLVLICIGSLPRRLEPATLPTTLASAQNLLLGHPNDHLVM